MLISLQSIPPGDPDVSTQAHPGFTDTWTFIVTGMLVLSSLYLAGIYNYLLFHSLIEGFSIVIACGVFMIAWNARALLTNDYLLLLGIAYLFVAFVDMAHLLGYEGMGVFPGYDANLSAQLWIGARYIESISLLVAPLFLRRQLPLWTATCIYGVVTLLILITVFGGWFPDCFVKGQGLTGFKVFSEYLISIILVVAAVGLYRSRDDIDNKVYRLMIASIGLTVASEMAFTLYVDIYGLANLTGHFLKLASFYLIYKAVIETGLSRPYSLLFRDLKRTKEELEQTHNYLEERVAGRTRDLALVNQQLTREVEARRQSEAALAERAKEFGILYELGRIIENKERSIEETLEQAVRLFPGGWQFSESAVGSITYGTQHYMTGNLDQCISTMSASLVVGEETVGSVAIGYMETFPEAFEGPFLKEERALIDMIASHLADFIERSQAQKQQDALEQQLHQAQRIESVGRLAGGVAHDFNNMLGVILGNVDIVLEELDSSHPNYGDLLDIQAAAQRAADLTRQLLAFARKQTINPRILNLNETIEGMTSMLRRLIGENIDLKWKPTAMQPYVRMDPGQIDQMLVNLVINARDAIQVGGRVVIETDLVNFDEKDQYLEIVPGEYVSLSVSDDGVGMDEETRAAIFEPFFTTKPQGTGLGLATVYGIVRQNGGFIDVFSEPGQGATLRLYLPTASQEEPLDEGCSEEEKDDIAKGGEQTILLVEDELSLLTLATRQLERIGYTVLAANTPERALELVREESGSSIDLVITDVVMPGMNGNDLFRELSRMRPDLKCIFMSGYTADAMANNGVLESHVHFLQKPFSEQDLARKLQEVLRH